MLSNTLNTNEIKNAAGTEVEFGRTSQGPGQTTTFSQISESLSLPHKLIVSHQETGEGIKRVRRSAVRFNKTVMSTVDATLPVTVSFYVVGVVPIGALVAATEPANVLAELLSFCASTGANTTILYDGTGNGAVTLLTGGL